MQDWYLVIKACVISLGISGLNCHVRQNWVSVFLEEAASRSLNKSHGLMMLYRALKEAAAVPDMTST